MNDRVWIVGGGPSLHKFNFDRLVSEDVIAVNKSVFDLPKAKYFITMDYTFMTRTRICGSNVDHKRLVGFSSNPAKKFFVVGSGGKFEKRSEFTVVDTFTGLVYDLHLFNEVIWANERGGIGTSFDDFRSTSDSGYSALQLSVLLGYKEVYLLGMDFTVNAGRTHYHDLYGANKKTYQKRLDWFMSEYGGAFREIKQKTNTSVFCCSSISRLNSIIPFVDAGRLI